MKYIFFLFPIFLQAQCLIPTHSYRLICADEVRYADSISSGSRLYISSKNAFVTSPRSVFSLVNGYGQHFIQITNSANSQKVAINRAWINRIDSTSSNKALIYIKDISVTFTTTESYTAVKDSAIACFIRSVASGLATLSDGDYGDVVVSGGGLVMTVDKPDLGLHNLADGDFSVVADSTALSLTGTRSITLQTKSIDGWISRYLQTHNSLTLRTNSSTKNSRIFVDTTGANFQFVNGANNASLRIGDSVAVRFNTSGSVGQVLTVTSVDGDGRLVINPKTGGSGTANCEQTLTKNSHGFRKWTPIYWNGSAWVRPTFDSIIPTYIVVDSTSANTFKVSNCGNYSSTLTAGLYYYKGASPGYSLTPTSTPTPLFEVAQSRLILQPLVGFQLAGGGGSGDVTRDELADSTAAIRADFPNGIISALPNGDVNITGQSSSDLRIQNTRIQFDNRFKVGQDSSFVHDPNGDTTSIKGVLRLDEPVGKHAANQSRVIIRSGGDATNWGSETGSLIWIGGNTRRDTASRKGKCDGCVIIGSDAYTEGGGNSYYHTVIGEGAYSKRNEPKSTIVGALSFSLEADNVVLGFSNENHKRRGISVGTEISITADSAYAFGHNIINNFKYSMAVGFGAATTEQRQIMLGSSLMNRIAFYGYGTSATTAAALSKTESGYVASFATDGTMLSRAANTERYNTITSTTSPQTLSSTIADNLINQGGTQGTFTFRLPASPVDGQISKATFANTVTVLTIDGNGTAVTGTLPTTVALGTQIIFKNYTGVGWVRQL